MEGLGRGDEERRRSGLLQRRRPEDEGRDCGSGDTAALLQGAAADVFEARRQRGCGDANVDDVVLLVMMMMIWW